MNRPPITRDILASIVKGATDALPPRALLRFLGVSVSPYLVTVRYRIAREAGHMFWVVATSGEKLLLFDDLEEYFSTGVLDDDGILRTWGNFTDGGLDAALEDLLRFGEDAGP